MQVMGSGKLDAKIMLVGEAPGADEVRFSQPFVGQSGQELDRMLHDAGIMRTECYATNVFKSQPPGNKIDCFLETKKGHAYAKGFKVFRDRYIRPDLEEHINYLEREIGRVNPDVIIALGDTALWALTGNSGITKWRGSVLPSRLRRPDGQAYKVIPTYHPAAILRNWPWRFIAVHDLRRAKTELDQRGALIYEPPYNFIVRPSFEAVTSFLLKLRDDLEAGPVKFTVDTETRWHRHIACIGIGRSKLDAICIPILSVEKPEGYWSVDEEEAIILLLRYCFLHPNALLAGQNWLYDSQYFAKEYGFAPPPTWMDTMVAWHVLFNSLPKGLDFIASMNVEHYRYWKSEGKEWDPKTMPEEQYWTYNCRDCVNTFECAESIEAAIKLMGMEKPFQFQHELFPAVLRMMLRGVRYDHDLKPFLAKDLEKALEERLQYFRDILGHDLNPNSNKQMKELFYGDLKQKEIKNRKTKNPTLDEDALKEIGKREPLLQPLVQGIGEYRSARVFKSTFIDAAADTDGRMRCSYNICGTKTYRFASSENAFNSGMNLQNLSKGTQNGIVSYLLKTGPSAPALDIQAALRLSDEKFHDQLRKAEEDGFITISASGNQLIVHFRFSLPNVRRLSISDDDYYIVDMDLDRADLQVVVWEADDQELKQMLRSGMDMHSENAKVLGCDRQMAKMFVHGTNYGGSARTMAINCNLTVHTADQMQKRWFKAHPGILEYHRRTKEALYATRSVQTKFGFKGWFFDRIESIVPDALAWVPQATVGNVINMALRNIDKTFSQEDVQILLQVHDSLTMQVRKSKMPYILNDIRKQALITIPYPDPLIIPVSFSVHERSWGEVKPLEEVYPDFKLSA